MNDDYDSFSLNFDKPSALLIELSDKQLDHLAEQIVKGLAKLMEPPEPSFIKSPEDDS